MAYPLPFNTRTWFVVFISIVMCFFFSGINSTLAQFATLGGGTLQLTLDPQFPTPYSSVVVSIDDYSVDTTGATISWYVDGVEQTASRNERSIKIGTSAPGAERVVRVVAARSGGLTLSSTRSIFPTSVDIITEANTYTPQFYEGRPLSSRNSSVRAISVINDGTSKSPSAYTYKWTLDGTVLFGGPSKGKNIIDISLSTFGDGELSVEVTDDFGNSIGRGNAQITPVEPQIHFYEYSPLRGLSLREAKSPFTFVSDEVTLFGEPYYLNSPMRIDRATFSWKVGGLPVQSDTHAPHSILLQRTGDAGESVIEYSVTTKGTVPQYAGEMLRLIFD